MSRLSLTLACILGLSVTSCDRDQPEAVQESGTVRVASGEFDRMMAGELMPNINVTDPQGRTLNLAALQGEPVLVNLWATWCAPCVKEMPLLDQLASDFDGKLRVVTISQDSEKLEKVPAFFASGEFSNLKPWLDPENEVGLALGISDMPTTVLFDAQGREVWRIAGDYDWSGEEARAAIESAIGE